MDDQRTDREGGGGLKPTIRMVLLMALGAFIGATITPRIVGSSAEIEWRAQARILAVILGALVGLGTECLIRPPTETKAIKPKFSIRDLLILITIAAIGCWILTTLW
jgi:hypothetical protein